jgi:hypothetical protein
MRYKRILMTIIFRHVGSIILRVTYGITKEEDLDFYVNLVDKAAEGNAATLRHGNFMVDYIPLLKYVPGKYLIAV